jgi:hypothetical protein
MHCAAIRLRFEPRGLKILAVKRPARDPKFHNNVHAAADPMWIDVDGIAKQPRAFVKLDDGNRVAVGRRGRTAPIMAQRSRSRLVFSVMSFQELHHAADGV